MRSSRCCWARCNFPPTCCELVAAISWVVWITTMGPQPTPQSSYQARYPSLLFLCQPAALPEWKVTSGALFCSQGQRSALVPVPGRSCRKRKCQRGRAVAVWFFPAGISVEICTFSPFSSAPLPAPFCPTVVQVLLLRSLFSFLSSPLPIIRPFPFSPLLFMEMHASFPIMQENHYMKIYLTYFYELMTDLWHCMCTLRGCFFWVCVFVIDGVEASR